MQLLTLSKPQVRKIILHAAGLARPAQFGTGIEAVYRLIDHLGFVQLDTNYVVERAHHHVMAARVPDYEPGSAQKFWSLVFCPKGLCPLIPRPKKSLINQFFIITLKVKFL
jgi:hypothetical protein